MSLVFTRKPFVHPEEFLTFGHHADETAAPTQPPRNPKDLGEVAKPEGVNHADESHQESSIASNRSASCIPM